MTKSQNHKKDAQVYNNNVKTKSHQSAGNSLEIANIPNLTKTDGKHTEK